MDKHFQKINMHDYDNNSSVIRFGSDVFSSLILPSTCFYSPDIYMTTAINPQDVILNNQVAKSFPLVKDNDNIKHQAPLGSTLMIGPTGYIETVRSPYLNFKDIFFDASPTDLMFSIECPDTSSNSSICASPPGLSSPFTGFDKSIYEESISLPPSSAILQSELDNSSIANNSFIEEIKASLTVEQQQYINSGMTRLSSTYSRATTTNPSITKESYSLITPTFSHDYSIFRPDLTAYKDIFEDEGKPFPANDKPSVNNNLCHNDKINLSLFEDENDDDYNIEEDIDDDEINEYLQSFNNKSEEFETRLKSLLEKLNRINSSTDFPNIQSTLKYLKTEHISDIANAFICKHQKLRNNRLADLCSSVIKAYNNANRIKNTEFSVEICDTKIQQKMTNKKRKNNDDTSRFEKQKTINTPSKFTSQQQNKKSRKNYDVNSINVLMDWYLKNNGKVPSNESRRTLAKITGKSDVQISTWFQNARRRHQKKLENYYYFSSRYPSLVYDFQSFKSYQKMNKN